MKHYSILAYSELVESVLKGSSLNYINDGHTLIIEHLGALDMESVRPDINRLAFMSGQSSVYHFNFGVGVMEHSDGSWNVVAKEAK